jgi:hypothetical protein
MFHPHAIQWTLLDHSTPDPVRVGDVVSAEAGGMPIFHVVALVGDQAWLADERETEVKVMPLTGFRWRGAILDEVRRAA